MINADSAGGIHCRACGAYHHFSRPCPGCSRLGSSPGGAVLPPPQIAVGALDAAQARAEADAARTGAGGLRVMESREEVAAWGAEVSKDWDEYLRRNAPKPRAPLGDREWGGS